MKDRLKGPAANIVLISADDALGWPACWASFSIASMRSFLLIGPPAEMNAAKGARRRG
jgi:hypothetical protein